MKQTNTKPKIDDFRSIHDFQRAMKKWQDSRKLKVEGVKASPKLV